MSSAMTIILLHHSVQFKVLSVARQLFFFLLGVPLEDKRKSLSVYTFQGINLSTGMFSLVDNN